MAPKAGNSTNPATSNLEHIGLERLIFFSDYESRVATIFYASVIILAGLLSFAIWQYASYHDRLIDPQVDAHRRRYETWSPLAVSAVFLLSIGLAFFNTGLARLSWILVTLALLSVRY
jgi:hypothetical protein